MKALLLAAIGAIVSVLAFPPFGPGWLVVLGVSLFLTSLRLASTRNQTLLVGALYGLGFFGGLIWWMSELGIIAVVPLVLVQAAFFAVYGWWLGGYRDVGSGRWLTLSVGGWAVLELVRYRFPVGGFEWGAVGYALSDSALTRIPAPSIGNSGLTVLVVLIAGLIAQLATRSTGTGTLIGAGVAGVLVVGSSLVFILTPSNDAEPFSVAIVQGSTPCPFEHCSPNERLRTYEQHLALTETIPSGRVDLVVWSEGSTGSVNADPVQNPAIGAAIGAEARRIGGWMLVGSDRPVSSEEWYNANVLFNPAGEIVGEYRKQHAVPFGEYIPLRPVFDWIPELAAVPRDMIPGDGPVVFDLEDFQMGSVISFEGVFSRYARGHTRSGAEVMVVATNEGSYGETAASDQLIGMTRMRAAELGVFVIHAAVTGKSVVIDSSGKYASEVSDLAEQIVVYGDVVPTRAESPYSRFGNVVITVAAVAGILMWWRSRSLVGSSDGVFEKE